MARPKRFEVLGIESFGYSDEVVFPIQLALERPGDPLRVKAAVDYLTCREICIPYQATLQLDLPAGTASPSAEAGLLADFIARVPDDGVADGLAIDAVGLAGAGDQRVLVAAVRTDQPLAKPDLFVESAIPVDFGAPRVTAVPGGRGLRSRFRAIRRRWPGLPTATSP